MINFIQEKKSNYTRIKELLSLSRGKKQYTNNGPVKELLEKKLHLLLSLKEDKCVLCCSNGTTALHILMCHCTNKYNVNKWVTPAFTFPSCVIGHNFNIDILDIDPNTYTLPLDEKVLGKYDGIIITNLFGTHSNIEKWNRYCNDTKKVLIFDNAASPLTIVNGINICNFGTYNFGSLHHTKYLGFGEGGFIVAPKEEYEKLSAITNFGFWGNREYEKLSSNFKMSDISAAFILDHIERYNLDNHIARQNRYLDKIDKIDYVKSFNYSSGILYNTFPILFNKQISEDRFIEKDIQAHKYYNPLLKLPHSTNLYNRIINLPLYSDLAFYQIEYIDMVIKGLK